MRSSWPYLFGADRSVDMKVFKTSVRLVPDPLSGVGILGFQTQKKLHPVYQTNFGRLSIVQIKNTILPGCERLKFRQQSGS